MDYRAEYDNFLRYFHARHGYVTPPIYQEWLYNISCQNRVQSSVNSIPICVPVLSGFK